MTRVISMVALMLSLLLAGCSGTIQRESAGGTQRLQGMTYRSVDVVMSENAKSLLNDNPQYSSQFSFSPLELGDNVRRRLQTAKLMNTDAKNRVVVTVEAFKVRDTLAAAAFQFLAGTDFIDGYVRVFDERGSQLHAYKVSATYSGGGMAGSLEAIRMSIMYDKFGELAAAELAGTTEAGNVTPGDATSASPAAKP
ncbi:hypothetical protein [Caenimonas koreensis]|uniref:hypothetical protein n=1 Tax=Caenimonas koreensis TaxID=367474 RepID=UPI003783C04A